MFRLRKGAKGFCISPSLRAFTERADSLSGFQ
jgi:hypothetical protein